MHDPMTVAHEIYLGRKKKKNGSYRLPIITIWHVDPEADGTDDSCGWTFPKVSKGEREWLDKIANNQYRQLFARKIALLEEKSYASLCYNQDPFGVIYWMWRHFNKKFNKVAWQYGEHISNKEFQYVYKLATNPVDNFQHHKCNDIKEFEKMLYLIFRSWKRYHRKWYQHPRWHIHHWKIQFHPL